MASPHALVYTHGMPRWRSRAGRTDARVPDPAPLNAPFRSLEGELRRRLRPTPPVASTRSVRAATEEVSTDPQLFQRAMQGVVRIVGGGDGRVELPPPGQPDRKPTNDQAEALAALSDLVAGVAEFDITETREYVEGLAVGVDPRLVRKLRRGEFAWRVHLDLHGLVAATAHQAVVQFLATSIRSGERCVLIVHGRGLNSKDQTPVLKERLKTWLSRGRAARLVLAFATARACDGGTGALYVLLRRDRRRRAFRVNEGAKL